MSGAASLPCAWSIVSPRVLHGPREDFPACIVQPCLTAQHLADTLTGGRAAEVDELASSWTWRHGRLSFVVGLFFDCFFERRASLQHRCALVQLDLLGGWESSRFRLCGERFALIANKLGGRTHFVSEVFAWMTLISSLIYSLGVGDGWGGVGRVGGQVSSSSSSFLFSLLFSSFCTLLFLLSAVS